MLKIRIRILSRNQLGSVFVIQACTDRFCRTTNTNDHRRNIIQNCAADTDHCASSYSHSWSDEDVSSDPRFIFNNDRPFGNHEVGIFHIMTSGTEVRTLRDYSVAADLDLSQAIQSYLVTNPRKVPNRNFPRVGYVDGWPDQHSPTNSAAKNT